MYKCKLPQQVKQQKVRVSQITVRQINPTFALFLPPLAAAAVLPAALLELPAVHKADFIAIRFVAEQPY